MRLITPGEFDVMGDRVRRRGKGGWLYYYASPDERDAAVPLAHELDGPGVPERVTPADARRGRTSTTSRRARIGRSTPARPSARRR